MSAKLGNVSLTLNDTVENWVMDLLSDVDTSLSTLRLYNGTTTSLMTVLRNGKVGFGIDNPNSTVHVATSMAVTRIGSAPHIVLCGAGGGTLSSPTATLADGGIGKISGNTYDGTNWVTSADITMYASENATSGSRGGYITFNTIPTGSATLAERMRLDSTGLLLLGTNASRQVGGAARSIQVEKTGQASISLTRNSANTIGPNVVFGKTRGSDVGSSNAVVSGDELGTIHFAGADGTNLQTNGANIQAFAEGTISTGVVPARLSMSTMNSSGSMVERLRIDSAGTISTYGLTYNSGTYSWGGSLALANADVVANKRALLTLPGGDYVGEVFVVTSRTANDGSSTNRAAYKFRVARTGGATGTYAQFFVELAEEDTNMAVSYQWYFDTTTGNAYLRFGQTGNSYGWTVETRFGGAAAANIMPILAVDSGTAPTGTAITPNRTIGNANTPTVMAFSTAGAERARIDGSGNFGIGTTSPNTKLEVVSYAADVSARVWANNTSGAAIQQVVAGNSTTSSNYAYTYYLNNDTTPYSWKTGTYGSDSYTIRDETAGANRLVIDTSGNVGIGTNTPAVGTRIHAVTPASTACIFRAESSSYGYMDVGQSATGAFLFARSSDANYGSLYFGSGGVERLRIDVNGNMGLGVAPSAWGSYKAFDVGAAGNGLYGISSEIGLTSNAYFNSGWKYGASSIVPTRYASGGGYHQWYAAASGTAGGSFTWSPLMSLDSNGYLTLNGSARMLIQPSATVNNALLQFNNGAGNGYVGLDSASGSLDVPYALTLWHTGAYPIVMGTNNAERMRIDATGNVSIGTTGTTDRFTVQSPLTGTTTGSNTVARFQTSGSGYDAHIALGDAVNAAARLGYLSGALYAWTNGAERMRIDTSGNVGIGLTDPTTVLTGFSGGSTGVAIASAGVPTLALYDSENSTYKSYVANSSGDMYVSNSATGKSLIFSNAGSERMRIDSTGNLGLGTSAPAARLDIGSDSLTVPNTQTAILSRGADVNFRLVARNGVSSNNAGDTTFQFGQAYSTGAVAAGFSFVRGGSDSSGYLKFVTNSTNQMVLDTYGNLGLGVTPSAWNGNYRAIEIQNGSISNSTSNAIRLNNNVIFGSTTTTYKVTDFATSYLQYQGQHQWYTAPSGTAGNPIAFTQAMTLDATGRLLVGTTASTTISGVSGALQVRGATADTSYVSISRNSADANSGVLSFGKERAGAIVQSGDALGSTLFAGYDGASYVTAASISAAVDGAPGTNDMPGRLVFSTTADGASTPTERMRIDSSGNVGIGTSSPTQKLDVVDSVDVCGQIRTTGTTNSAFLTLSNGNGTTSYGYSYVRFLNNDATGQQWRIGTYGSNNFTIRDHTVGTARLVIDTSGNVMVGQTSPIYNMANRRVLNVDGASTALISVSSGGAGATSGYLYWDGGNLSLANNNTTGSLLFGTNGGTTRMEITAAGVIQDGAGNELGWKNIPPVSNSFERAKCNVITANATVGTSNAGDVYSVYNNSSVSVTLTPSGVTMYLGGTNSTGARTLLPHGFATIWFRTSTECVINGNVT